MDKSVDDMDMKEYGLHLGYPECCVISFIDDIITQRVYTREDRKLTGTGFVPCASCNEKHSEEELVSIINENRKHSVPFPDWGV